jgi:hypothetical protein
MIGLLLLLGLLVGGTHANNFSARLARVIGGDGDDGVVSHDDVHNSAKRRFVHRHEQIGVGAGGADHIGCAEAHAMQFEQMLTPPVLWCDATNCLSEFDVVYRVHSIDCDAESCTVLLHCAAELERIKWASLMTLAALFLLIAMPFFCSAQTVRDAIAAQRRDLASNGDKRL